MTARQHTRQATHNADAPCAGGLAGGTRRTSPRARGALLAVLALGVTLSSPPAQAQVQAPAQAGNAARVAIEATPLAPVPDTTALAVAPPKPAAAPVIDGWSSRTAPDEPGTPPVQAASPAATSAVGAAASGATDDDHAAYERALGAIEAGKPAEGQRLLEQLVARSPGSPLANEARRRLAEIYARAFAPPDAAVAAAPAPATAGRDGAVAAEPPTLAALPPDKPAAWRDRARRTHRFEGMLGAEVGDRVFFGLSSSDVGARARVVLERQARWIARYPDLYVVVEGHSDEPGDAAQNRALSLERAEKARRLLIASGLSPDRIDIDPRGSQDRVASCDSAQCQAQNRRVVTRLMVVLPAGRDRSSAGEEPPLGAPRLATDGGGSRLTAH